MAHHSALLSWRASYPVSGSFISHQTVKTVYLWLWRQYEMDCQKVQRIPRAWVHPKEKRMPLSWPKVQASNTVAPPSPDCWRFLAHRQARSIMHRLFSPGASSPGVQNRVGLLNFHNILHCRESPGLQHRLGALNQKVRLLRTGLRSRDREEEGCLENWVWVTCWFYSHGVQRPAQERALSW